MFVTISKTSLSLFLFVGKMTEIIFPPDRRYVFDLTIGLLLRVK